MIVNYQVDETGRFQNVTTFPLDESAPKLELADDFNVQKIHDYILQYGELVYDPLPKPEVEPESNPYVTWDDLAAVFHEGVNSI